MWRAGTPARLCRSEGADRTGPSAIQLRAALRIGLANMRPGFLRGLDELEQAEVTLRDNAFLDQSFEIDDPVPEFPAEKEDRHRLDLARLDQGEKLERLVERAE